MCLKNEGKVVKKIKKHKMNLTYINTWCMVIIPYRCRQESPANKCQQKMEKNFLKKRVGCPLGEYIVLLQDIDSLDLQYFMQLYRIQQHCIV